MKTIIWIVVVIIVALGAWYFWGMGGSTQVPATGTQQAAQQNPAPNPAAPAAAAQTLDQSLLQVDAQVDTAAQSGTSVEQSFTDQPIQQTI